MMYRGCNMIDVMVREALYLIQLEVPRIFYLTVSNVSIVRRRAAEEYSNEEGYIVCSERRKSQLLLSDVPQTSNLLRYRCAGRRCI